MVKNSFNKIVGLSVLVIGLVAGLTLIEIPQNVNEKAEAATSLYLTPSYQEVNLGTNFTKIITMDSGVNKVTGIDLELTFDPDQIHINEIKPTTELANFNTILKNIVDNDNGKLRYASFTLDKELGIKGKLNLLTIYGTIPADSSQQEEFDITFLPSSLVVATGEEQSVLTNLSGATIKIIGGLPNSCGGTCGSNENCQSNYFCYIENGKNDGYCRNPICPTDKSCGCTVSATATPKPTTKPTQKPAVISKGQTAKPALTPTNIPTVKPVPTYSNNITLMDSSDNLDLDRDGIDTTNNKENMFLTKYASVLIGMLILIVSGIVIYFVKQKYNKSIPHIMPPTNI